jgi:hypothetical protein
MESLPIGLQRYTPHPELTLPDVSDSPRIQENGRLQ